MYNFRHEVEVQICRAKLSRQIIKEESVDNGIQHSRQKMKKKVLNIIILK